MNLTKEKNQASMGHDLLNYLMTIFANGPPLKVVHYLSERNSLKFPDSCINQLSILKCVLENELLRQKYFDFIATLCKLFSRRTS